jgi:hypothetical protein
MADLVDVAWERFTICTCVQGYKELTDTVLEHSAYVTPEVSEALLATMSPVDYLRATWTAPFQVASPVRLKAHYSSPAALSRFRASPQISPQIIKVFRQWRQEQERKGCERCNCDACLHTMLDILVICLPQCIPSDFWHVCVRTYLSIAQLRLPSGVACYRCSMRELNAAMVSCSTTQHSNRLCWNFMSVAL